MELFIVVIIVTAAVIYLAVRAYRRLAHQRKASRCEGCEFPCALKDCVKSPKNKERT